MLLEDFGRLPATHNPKLVDPALLTFKEWAKLVDAGKSHPSTAYNWSVAKMNEFGDGPEKYTKLIQRVRRHGLDFEVKMKTEKCRYGKWNPETYNYERDERGDILYFTDEEALKMGRQLEEYLFAIFNDKGQRVAIAQDEFNCALVAVAEEYREFGLGAILSKIIYTIYPDWTTGGTTNNGFAALRRVHRDFVADALRSGRYRSLIETGQTSYARVKEICASAGLPRTTKPRNDVNLKASDDPGDWLLYADGFGTFIFYDKRLMELYREGEKYQTWMDDFIKGMINVSAGERYGIIFRYGGETKGLRSFLLRCAAQFCEEEDGCQLVIDPEDKSDVDPRFLKLSHKNNKSGYWRYPAKIVGEPLDVSSWIKLEALTRRIHDRYDEFKHFMIELAEAKYRHEH